MKIRLEVALVGLAISCALPIFAQQKDTADPRIAQQIRMLAAKYDEAFNSHDAAAVAALYTEGGARSFQNGTVHGRQAIEKDYARDFQRWHANDHFTTVDRVIAAGNEIRLFGRWSYTFKEDVGRPRSDNGYYRWVLVREGDSWKIHRETITESILNSTQEHS
jgi:uncharacterized protein (TIGR02246 family)